MSGYQYKLKYKSKKLEKKKKKHSNQLLCLSSYKYEAILMNTTPVV